MDTWQGWLESCVALGRFPELSELLAVFSPVHEGPAACFIGFEN